MCFSPFSRLVLLIIFISLLLQNILTLICERSCQVFNYIWAKTHWRKNLINLWYIYKIHNHLIIRVIMNTLICFRETELLTFYFFPSGTCRSFLVCSSMVCSTGWCFCRCCSVCWARRPTSSHTTCQERRKMMHTRVPSRSGWDQSPWNKKKADNDISITFFFFCILNEFITL